MPGTLVAEALRAAVNTTPSARNISADGSASETIQTAALKRAAMLNPASAIASAVGQLNPEVVAIEAAVATLGLAYAAITEQIGVVENARVTFEKEINSGISTFELPNNVEGRSFSKEQRAIRDFIDLAKKYPALESYLGIHTSDVLSDNKFKFHSILPFYCMGAEQGESFVSGNALDAERRKISLFLNQGIHLFLENIQDEFQYDWVLKSFFESVYQRKNYLNDRRAFRFIIMALANLLWNLQHPVNRLSGFPLTLQQNIALCQDVEDFLSRLLNPDLPPNLQIISSDANQLMSCLRQMENYTKDLRNAYVKELAHGVNIDELTNSAHSALRIMDIKLFELLYKKMNSGTKKKEPNERAAGSLAEMIGYLSSLIASNPTLMTRLHPIPKGIPTEALLNNPPRTVIDLLIIFTHISGSERDGLLAKFKGCTLNTEIEFPNRLRDFHTKFVKPIREAIKQEKGATLLNPMSTVVGCLTAQRLMPFISLLIQDFGLSVDTAGSERDAIDTRTSPLIMRTSKEQMHAIDLSAQAGGSEYYQWALSPFAEGAKQLDELPKYQYRLTQMTELLDSVADIVKNYRSFLLQKSFQTFLKKCLANIQKEYVALDRRIDDAAITLRNNEHVSRGLQSILSPMMSELNSNLAVFSAATSNFERVVTAEDFTGQQRQELSTKISTVAQQFQSLFTEDSGLSAFLNATPVPLMQLSIGDVAMRGQAMASAGKVGALSELVGKCYDALSVDSKNGRKVLLLRELKERIRNTPNFTEPQIKHLVMELVRITASYRQTWFFQAAYGQTRSAKALIAAIKDPELNSRLPLASIIFNNPDPRVSRSSDQLILQRLMRLRDEKCWQHEANSMRLSQKSDEAIEREASLAMA